MQMARHTAFGITALLLLAAGSMAVTLWVSGYRVYVVHTGSMTPTIGIGDAVVDRPADGSLHVGQVVTFRSHVGNDAVVTHRIYSIHGRTIRTKGDANRSPDEWRLTAESVVGRALTHIPDAGYALVYLKQPSGVASLMTAVLALILLHGFFWPTGRRQTPQQC